jgi:hypothetical protein
VTGGGGAGGAGTVFQLSPTLDGPWTESVLYSFCSRQNCPDGADPRAALVFDAAGNLYGTTLDGGYPAVVGGYPGASGVVFKLRPNGDGTWTETLPHTFAGRPAANPVAGLIFDPAGNIYGTTEVGGPSSGGVVFKMAPQSNGSWAYSVLHVFVGNPALNPYSGVVLDKAGNLYGTTYDCAVSANCFQNGVVYEITP